MQTYLVDRVLATISSRVTTVLRIAAGAVFIGFGPGKFIRHTAVLLLLVRSGAGPWSLDTRLGQRRGGSGGKVFFPP